MFRRYRHLILGVLGALLIPLSAAPVAAAQSGSPAPPTPVFSGSGTLASYQAAFAALPAPTAQQMAIAQAWLAKHPQMAGSVAKIAQPKGTSTSGVTPYVSVQWEWFGIRLHLTRDDVHNIWDLIWAAGIGAAAAILCAPGGWLAVACAIGGAVIAYIVAELIWNVIGYWVPWCGVHIDFYLWWGGYGYGAC
ncbi:MAG: hypothetical protein E6J20_03850 [Chloroflexi bacterium]|nr:MAG: hypothetical protein E6J20_03850 [Chloroflexota bacterium]